MFIKYIDTLKEFLTDDPNDTFVLFALAKEYEKQKLLKLSLDTFLHLKDKDVNYVGLYYHLGKLYEELGETDLALLTYEDGVSVAKKAADFHALSELHNAKMNLEIEI